MILVNFIFFCQCICMGFKCISRLLLCFKEVDFIAGVMVNFMDQLDYTTGHPDVWSNTIILGMSVRVFQEEINMWSCRLSKANCRPHCKWLSSNQLVTWMEQKKLRRGNACLTAFLLGPWSFPAFTLTLKSCLFLGLKPAGFLMELTTWLS